MRREAIQALVCIMSKSVVFSQGKWMTSPSSSLRTCKKKNDKECMKHGLPYNCRCLSLLFSTLLPGLQIAGHRQENRVCVFVGSENVAGGLGEQMPSLCTLQTLPGFCSVGRGPLEFLAFPFLPRLWGVQTLLPFQLPWSLRSKSLPRKYTSLSTPVTPAHVTLVPHSEGYETLTETKAAPCGLVNIKPFTNLQSGLPSLKKSTERF